jgi:hypothetical protein
VLQKALPMGAHDERTEANEESDDASISLRSASLRYCRLVRVGDEGLVTSLQNTGRLIMANAIDADSDAASVDAELRLLIDRWPSLSIVDRQRILAIASDVQSPTKPR